MILIPQRLFDAPGVRTLLRDGNVCILYKELHEPTLNREGYISNHVVSIVLSGAQWITTYDEKRIEVVKGEVLFIPRGMYHVSDLLPEQGTFKSLLFYFDDAIIQEFLAHTQVSEISRKQVPDHLKFGNIPVIQSFAQSLLSLYPNPQLRQKALLPLKVQELLHLLNGLVPEQQFANFLFRLTLPQKRNIKTFMEKNYHKPLKVEDYAYLTGRSMSTFRRDFKSFFQVTPQQWLMDKRMERALSLMEQQERSVTDLAYEVGYENISYFIKAFKEKYGQSPKQYMLSHHRNQLRN